ncbi:collagenase-like protease, partial [Staphylococcus lugdunensis]
MKTLEEVQSSSKTKMKKPELLAPAGNLEKLKIAVHYGADAVFL